MSLLELERAPACEITLTSDVPVNVAPDSEVERGFTVDEQGRITHATLRVVLEKDGEAIATCQIDCLHTGFIHQLTEFEAPDQWHEAWLTDGRVRVAAGHGGPKGFCSGLVWK